jgi:hypothetical protein
MNEIPHEDEPTRPAKGRLSARDSMMLMTVISAPDGRDIGKVRVRNLSSTGLMADCVQPLKAGDHVSLNLRGIGRVTGTVKWKRSDRIGVSFDSSIDPQQARKPAAATDPSDSIPAYLRDMDLKNRSR